MTKLLIFPTDTVYGLGTPYLDKEGLKQIYEIKGRDFNKPIAILISNLEQVKEIAKASDNALKVASKFWPGGLTLIFESSDAYYLQSGEKTIGLRMPNHKLALKLIDELGPLKTTSVNYSNQPPLNDYDAIMKVFGDKVDKVYPNEESLSEVSSTVIDFTHDLPSLIRQGDITLDEIMKVLEK